MFDDPRADNFAVPVQQLDDFRRQSRLEKNLHQQRSLFYILIVIYIELDDVSADRALTELRCPSTCASSVDS